MRAMLLVAGVALALGALAACSASLPEPESPGAQLYRARCNGCHRVYAPKLLKFEMWKIQFDRMEQLMVRGGQAPFTPEERRTVLEYLQRHSG